MRPKLTTAVTDPWKIIAFGDLHVSQKTLDRALAVLAAIRDAAIEHRAQVVCTGDFWDARGVLNVRQVDALFDEFDKWKEARIPAVFIPGNHDQVSTSGTIHGVRILSPYPTFAVATQPLLDYAKRIAYLPWREVSEEQSAQFDALEGTGWTIFGHAEVKGAITNGSHVALGRVTVSQIKAHARACYLGHYHKRQCVDIEGAIWYLGSPFEQSFGEMGDPNKGLALITSEQATPVFYDLEHLPQHRRVMLGDPLPERPIRAQDIVEVYGHRAQMGSGEMQAFIAALPATDVRPLPLKEDESTAPQAFALDLDQAIKEYVGQLHAEAESAGAPALVEGVSPEGLVAFGTSVLRELPDATKPSMISPEVDIKSLYVMNFAAVRGEVTIPLLDQGLTLIKGPIGVGKTALMDALSWCLYGETAPRKAGSHGSSFKGDEVINDHVDRCVVEVRLGLGSMWPELLIRREKHRGKGAKVTIEGWEVEDGVKDAQEVINRVLGLDYTLWRTCVSLGQGAVGNFVTDADKRRKELLSTAFGLDACPMAVELLRGRLKGVRASVQRAQMDADVACAMIAQLEGVDFTEQLARWEEQRTSNKLAAEQAGTAAKATIAECEKNLADEPKWLEAKTQYDNRLVELTSQLSKLTGGHRAQEIQREIGAAQAERAIVERTQTRTKAELLQLGADFDQASSIPCPTCGSPWDVTHAQAHITEKNNEVARATTAMQTFDARIHNLRIEHQNIQQSGEAERAAIGVDMQHARDALTQTGTALNTFTRLRANRGEAELRLAEARARWEAEGKALNPFAAEQESLGKRLATEREKHETLRKSALSLGEQEDTLAFWEAGFGAKGLPVLILRTVIHELEAHANRFLSRLLGGRIYAQVEMAGDDINVRIFEQTDIVRERRYEQLSGGQRRCVELAFSPFALSEMIFSRCGVKIPLLVIDELSSHLGQEEKPLVCDILRSLNRGTVMVIDHDVLMQGEFDKVLEVGRDDSGRTTLGVSV